MVKSNSDVKSIRKKLMAAVAMLLVACIMVVSSSYAWFTLSTAPEVTGIQTSVGANGNLEMALQQIVDGLDDIQTSNVAHEFPDANIFWGNLVDLSDGSYHLNEIALQPARLNAVIDPNASVQKKENGVPVWYDPEAEEEYAAVETDKRHTTDTPVYDVTAYKLANGGYLQTPVYGADGRLSALEANTVNGVYDDSEGKKAFVANSNKLGVRAVGVTSMISPAALVLRNAKLTVNNAITEGKSNATYSLRNDAVKLAQIYVAATINDSQTVTETEVGYIRTTVGRLNSILVDLENALKEAVVAVGVSEGKSFTADKVTFVILEGATTASDIAVDGDVDLLTWSFDSVEGTGSPAKADLIRAYNTLLSVKGTLTEAATNLANLPKNGDTYDMDDITNILRTLLAQDDFRINGKTVDELQSSSVSQLLSLVSGTVNVEIQDGVYYVIAQLVGNYSGNTSMEVKDVVYKGEPMGDLAFENVVMSTNVQLPNGAMPNGFHLPYIQGWLSLLVPVSAEGGETPELITDIYGYIVDLAFRTNATGSTLQLQTEAANRVNDSAATQGAGSYMEFTVANADYTVKQMIDLLQNVRVVFVDDNDVICGVAKLDVAYGAAIEKTAATDETKTYIDGVAVSGTEMVHELTAGTLTDNTVKAALYLYNYEVKSTGELEVTTKKTSSDITSLQQNVAAGVSALVFLDGDGVENGDVAISGNSMTGTMNLQFSSSATLTPMNYTFQEKLEAPVLALNGNELTISAPADADYTGVEYVVYVDGTALPTHITDTTYDLSDLIDSLTLTRGETYSIAVAATADGKLDSNKSNTVNWQVPLA